MSLSEAEKFAAAALHFLVDIPDEKTTTFLLLPSRTPLDFASTRKYLAGLEKPVSCISVRAGMAAAVAFWCVGVEDVFDFDELGGKGLGPKQLAFVGETNQAPLNGDELKRWLKQFSFPLSALSVVEDAAGRGDPLYRIRRTDPGDGDGLNVVELLP